jgi:hypothetical protein
MGEEIGQGKGMRKRGKRERADMEAVGKEIGRGGFGKVENVELPVESAQGIIEVLKKFGRIVE